MYLTAGERHHTQRNDVWFTSDTHFNHTNILPYCKRPFDTVEHMNERLIANWNETVTPDGLVFMLGDMFYGDHRRPPDERDAKRADILNRLNGTIVWIVGNHDNDILNHPKVESVHSYLELYHPLRTFILCHYPLESWNGMTPKRTKPTIHLCGHVHRPTIDTGRSYRYDIGVDANQYRPVSLSTILMVADTNARLTTKGNL